MSCTIASFARNSLLKELRVSSVNAFRKAAALVKVVLLALPTTEASAPMTRPRMAKGAEDGFFTIS
ncbi:hypothetical protein N7530_003242 [Penicillium desertorum]|uniref:Uncharacterized protein n=1 Tax=Penicillium desertorum TaxID=1303715 RepID=A0A9W9WVY6_9EURO|nr:hypothetical protein N7530_003242 [Penicillium desertorum]